MHANEKWSEGVTNGGAEFRAESGSEFIHNGRGLLAREAGEGRVHWERVQGSLDVLRARLQRDEALVESYIHLLNIHTYI